MGLTEYPYRRFLLFSAIGGIGWAIYTCLLAYWISTALGDFALASILISRHRDDRPRRRRLLDRPPPQRNRRGRGGA
jgi:hypothetical protein